MKVVTVSGVAESLLTTPLFTGGRVTGQPLVTPDMAQSFIASQVTFAPGARNKFHTHSRDQFLIVTAGKGICATEREQVTVTVGDVIHFPAGEKHWHGATNDSAFSHIYVTGAGSQTTQLEE